MIELDDHFEVPGTPAQVMQRFADVERVAQCVPGAALEGRDEEGRYVGTMTVAFGPKRLKFQGRLQCDFDFDAHTGVLTGGGAAAGRGAQVQITTRFAVREAAASTAALPRSVVEISSRTQMHGVLAQFAASGGAIFARQVMKDFAENLNAQLAADGATAAVAVAGDSVPGAREPEAKPQPVRPMSAGSLVWRTLLAGLRAFGLRLSSRGSR